MEIVLINQLKHILNKNDKARDKLMFDYPKIRFVEYNPKLMDKWKDKIASNDAEYERKRKKKIADDLLKHDMRHKRRSGEITEDEYCDFLESMEE
jgi:hypothetical protein